MSEWIFCKDRMPDPEKFNDREVLVLTIWGRLKIAEYFDGAFETWDRDFLEWQKINPKNIKAWAEIPTPPEDDGGEDDGEEIED